MSRDDNTIPPHELKQRRRGIYILPSLLTTASLFAGFYAIVQAMNGNFELAPPAIFIASCPMCLCQRSPLHGQRMNPISSCLTYLKIISSLLVKVGSGDTPPNLSIEKGAPHVSRSATSCIPMPFACNIRSLAAGNDLFICNSRCEPSRQLEYP